MRAAGIRRRVVLVGEGESLAHLRRTLASARGGHRVRARRRRLAKTACPAPCASARRAELAAVLERIRPDEVILAEAALDERAVLEVVEQAHRQGIKVRLAPDTTELLVQRGEYVPGPRCAALRAAPAGAHRLGLGAEAGVRPASSARSCSCSGCRVWLLIALAVKLDSRGPVFFVDRRIGVGEREFGMLKFRTMVADAGLAADAARGGERGRGGALQDPRRPARDPRRPLPPTALARRDPADRQRPQGRDEPRGPAAAAAPRLPPARGLAPGALRRAARDDRPLADLRSVRPRRSTTSCGSTSRTSRTGRSGSTSRSSRGRSPRSSCGGVRTSGRSDDNWHPLAGCKPSHSGVLGRVHISRYGRSLRPWPARFSPARGHRRHRSDHR